MALPAGLRFLALGWWVVHSMAFLLVYQWGFVRGRGAEKRQQRSVQLAKDGK